MAASQSVEKCNATQNVPDLSQQSVALSALKLYGNRAD